MDYERFARILQDAFDECLMEMTKARRKTPILRLSRLKPVTRATREIPDLFVRLVSRLEPFRLSADFNTKFEVLADRVDAGAWIELLLEHHFSVQRAKSRLGKNPWFERYDDGCVMIRPRYCRDTGGKGDDSYVHGYRAWPLWSFARDLGEVTDA